MPDGSVQIIAQGDEENIKQLVHWCHIGPLLAVVDEVRVEDLEIKKFTNFKQSGKIITHRAIKRWDQSVLSFYFVLYFKLILDQP